MTNLQRRLLVASAAVIFFLGPLVIMGNCSGWNEGSMEVASCAIDVAPLRDLASALYGLVLLSAFMLGLPILAYVVAAFVGTRLVAAVLRRTFRDNTVAKPWGPLLAVMAVPALIVLSAVALVGMSLLDLRTTSGVFADRCQTAVEKITRAPDGLVEGLYFDSVDLPGYTPTDMVEDGWLRSSETLNPDTRPETQAVAKYLRYALYGDRSGEPVTAVTSQHGVFLKDLTSDADRQAGVEGAEISVKKLATDETLATTTYFMTMRGGRYCSAGQVQESDSWVNGVASSFSYVPFLVRALGLTQRAGAPLQPESKRARPRESSTPVHVGDEQTGTDWTLIAETDNSLIYIDKTGLSKDEQLHSVWRMENIDTPGADHVASVRSRLTVDCATRQFTPDLESAMSGPMGGGRAVFVPRQVKDPRAALPDSVGALMLNTVCGK